MQTKILAALHKSCDGNHSFSALVQPRRSSPLITSSPTPPQAGGTQGQPPGSSDTERDLWDLETQKEVTSRVVSAGGQEITGGKHRKEKTASLQQVSKQCIYVVKFQAIPDLESGHLFAVRNEVPDIGKGEPHEIRH